MSSNFEPTVLAFVCNWCSYAAADLAGVSRIQYPPNVRIVRVMCSGRVDPKFVLEAFEQGIDGVLVTGCRLGDCHYVDGNYQTEVRINFLREEFGKTGLEQARLRLEWISAAEGLKFAQIVTEMVESIRELGPNPLKRMRENVKEKA